MKSYFKSILVLYLVMALSIACTPSATPTADLSAYYGEPKAAVLTINGQQQKAGVGTSTWIISKSGDEVNMSHGDAFAMITPDQALTTTSSLTATLELPIPFAPSQLLYSVVATTLLEQEKRPEVGKIASFRASRKSIAINAKARRRSGIEPGGIRAGCFCRMGRLRERRIWFLD